MPSALHSAKPGDPGGSQLPPALPGSSLASRQELRDFEIYYRQKNARLFRLFGPIGILLILGFIPWDWAMSAEVGRKTAWVRIGLSGLGGFLLAVSRSEFFSRHQDMLLAFLIATCGCSFVTIFFLLPNGMIVGVGGTMLLVMYAAGAIRMNPVPTLVAYLAVLTLMLALMIRGGYAPFLIVSNTMLVGSVCLLGVLYNAWSRRDNKSIFLYARRLLHEKDRVETLLTEVTTMRAEREQWLENLARFLRHELKNQVTATETSVKLAGATAAAPPDARAQRYLDRATRSLERMRRLVESATEATSLEAALAAGEMGPVDFAILVAERGQAFRESHPDKKFELLLPTSLTVRGSEVRLEQLVDKLLGNAVEHTADGNRIRVALRVTAANAELRVENEGSALPEDKRTIFDPYVTTGTTAENTGLGLYVVKVIAEGHDGSVTAYDVASGSHEGGQTVTGAGFVVRLPIAS